MVLVHGSYNLEIDDVDVVSKVIDGDIFDLSSGFRVRLADIDAPEYWKSGFQEAKDYLSSLIDGKEVYIDIDYIYQTDKYDRLVCVVHVEYNSTHLINVNLALVNSGYAVIWNHPNEFNPITWILYCPNPQLGTRTIIRDSRYT